MSRLILILLFLSTPLSLFAQSVDLEPITVEKSFGDLSSGDEEISFSGLGINSPEEILKYSSGVGFAGRGSFGTQQDVSIRGSIFEDNSISLAGAPLNDPQTGHYSMEVPLTSADLEKVKLAKNSQRVDFIPKKPSNKGALIKGVWGSHALSEALVSVNFGIKNFNNRCSAEHKESKGGRLDTDFKTSNFSYHTAGKIGTDEAELLLACARRDFGADGFYSSVFKQEEEHIRQDFLSLKWTAPRNNFRVNKDIYLRHHRDKFILDRHRPYFYTNRHTTYVYGFSSDIDFYNSMFLKINGQEQLINSTNLKKHKRGQAGFTGGLRDKRLDKLVLGIYAGYDYFQSRGVLPRVHAGVSYDLNSCYAICFNFDRFCRQASFTELYYNDPANKGDENLKPQESNNFEAGFDYKIKDIFAFCPRGFYRRQFSAIDWGRNTLSGVWQAFDAGSISARGFDINTSLSSKEILRKVSLNYTYQDINRSSPYIFSKYVFDYSRHKLTACFDLDLKICNASINGNFAKPVNRPGYTVFGARFEKAIHSFTFALEGDNIFGKEYFEAADVEAEGRWYKASIECKF